MKLVISEHESQVIYCVIHHCLGVSCEVISENEAQLIFVQ